LFVSEDKERDGNKDDSGFVTKGKTELNYANNVLHKLPGMDGLERARAIKMEVKDNIAVLQPPEEATSRRQVEEDPENQLIKSLRQDQDMKWSDIAEFLNQERRQRGEAASFTEAAVYSRFVRNAPRVVTVVDEIGFDPKDYMHLRHPNQFNGGSDGTGLISKAGKKRIKNYDNAKELEANMRRLIKQDDHAELETAETTEQLMEAVAKVERNFWVLVADEMERMTTKLYPPNALASRYHAI
jgi:hypothetical protein